MTARPRSFWIWRASRSRARRCTASATCVTEPPSRKNCSTASARCIPDTIAFYDLTNVHGRADGKLPRFGRSKQKRNDCPVITLALALDGAGFPRSCEVLPGNVSEPGTLGDALSRLKAGPAAKPTVVMDVGTEANIAWRARLDCGQPWRQAGAARG